MIKHKLLVEESDTKNVLKWALRVEAKYLRLYCKDSSGEEHHILSISELGQLIRIRNIPSNIGLRINKDTQLEAY